MRLTHSVASALLLLCAGAAQAATSWGFDEGVIQVVPKKAGEVIKERTPLAKPVTLGATDTLKLSLTAKDNGIGKRPHQAFLLLQESNLGVEAPFPLTVKESGKATVQITQKDLPVQLLAAEEPLKASIVLASFGSAQGYNGQVFEIKVELDPNLPPPTREAPVRYGKKPLIFHKFNPDPKSPPKVVSIFFALAVIACLPVLLISWLFLGANIKHLPKALSAAPVSHAVFFGSIVAMEGVFFMYYTSWNLFQTLPVIAAVAVVTVLSGTKALGEVQSRRLAGDRY
ncbi:oligosaccharyltransferase subunit-like protein [Thermochaetoides thermophila DSM 1495]|uniref:Oligosaccharyltransferase subunit-like protein n=1 Tax=Chaetomium thermophilum (strain DSM 1495 / CBS 144.50 / IMI 039719) TaxID=759272 RepID=G0SCA6_CHATD|nr:oligosaccharyltransferase subunit-like protein [Thermochaetoides thermophila DSM 1495]EGS19032.1 oligosaccharyltransferase subunit-like protein [Thermochaetoides thermophila DSM 1495]